jgi:two-component system LytT family sensor kinase
MGYLIQNAPTRALDTLLRLTTLLRGVLRSEGEFTTLGHERDLIECYLRIERERFEDRLAIEIDIPDDLALVPIPALIVQPLVENAIKHGIAKTRDGGLVSLRARLTRDTLLIAVRNTGARMDSRRADHDGGVGLCNVKDRLACYFGNAASLVLRSEADGATVAELRMPSGEAEDRNVTALIRSKEA